MNKSGIIYLFIACAVSLFMPSCMAPKHRYGYGPKIEFPGLHGHKRSMDHAFKMSVKSRKLDTAIQTVDVTTILSVNITAPVNLTKPLSPIGKIYSQEPEPTKKYTRVTKTFNSIFNRVNQVDTPIQNQAQSSTKKLKPLFPNLNDEDKEALDILSCILFVVGIIFLLIPGLQITGLVLMGIAIVSMLLLDVALFIVRLLYWGVLTGLTILKNTKF